MAEVINVSSIKSYDFHHLYLDESTADVSFICEADKEIVSAHKIVLSALSTVFKTMFFGSDGDSNNNNNNNDSHIKIEKPIIRVADTTGAGFKEFIQHFYMDQYKATIENAAEVMNLSKVYGIHGLLDKYSDLMASHMPIDQLAQSLSLALEHDFFKLEEVCLEKIIRNPKEFFASEGFVGCSPDILYKLLNIEELKLWSEHLFLGCLNWANNAWKKGRVALDQPTLREIRKQLDDYFNLIEFGSMRRQTITKILYEYDAFFTRSDLTMINWISAVKDAQQLENLPGQWCIFGVSKNESAETQTITIKSTVKVYLVGYECEEEGLHETCVTIKASNGGDSNEVVLLRQRICGHDADEQECPLRGPLDTVTVAPIEPIIIEPGTAYKMKIELPSIETAQPVRTTTYFSANDCDAVLLANGGEISVQGSIQFISGLHFKYELDSS